MKRSEDKFVGWKKFFDSGVKEKGTELAQAETTWVKAEGQA